MLSHTLRTLAPALAFAALTQPAGAQVTDKGEFFSPDAVPGANRRIEAVKEKYHKTLVVESFKEIPPDRKEEFAELGKEKFFDRWAKHRAESLAVNGVYILLCKEPGR